MHKNLTIKALNEETTYHCENDAKADFNVVYHSQTPHAYIAEMAKNGYEIGERSRPYCAAAVELLQEKNGVTWPTQILDVGCSYGMGSAFVKYNCSFDELVAFFSSRAPMEYTKTCESTRQWINVTPPECDVRCVGLDCSRAAIRFAVDSGLLDGGIARNFESENETPSHEDIDWFRGCNMLMSTGAIGYVSDRTLHVALENFGESHPGSFGPIAVMTILRMFDHQAIQSCFEQHGYAFRKVPKVRLPQRNFTGDLERDEIISILHGRNLDTTDWEDHGKLYADLYIAAKDDDIDVLMDKMIATHTAVTSDDRLSTYINR
jgi:carnitine O-acetyltransferase